MRGRPRSSTLTIEYRIGDCVEVMKEYPENHFDACVTDPPYGLEFMGKEWDRLWQAPEDGTRLKAKNAIWNAAVPPVSSTVRRRVDRKSTRLNSSHSQISYAVFCL